MSMLFQFQSGTIKWENGLIINKRKYSFNSNLVRLNDLTARWVGIKRSEFQFQSGTIKWRFKMKLRLIPKGFQFQSGTIKCQKDGNDKDDENGFQFQSGTIKWKQAH